MVFACGVPSTVRGTPYEGLNGCDVTFVWSCIIWYLPLRAGPWKSYSQHGYIFTATVTVITPSRGISASFGGIQHTMLGALYCVVLHPSPHLSSFISHIPASARGLRCVALNPVCSGTKQRLRTQTWALDLYKYQTRLLNLPLHLLPLIIVHFLFGCQQPNPHPSFLAVDVVFIATAGS